MKEGWIFLSRNIQNHWLWKDEPYDKARAWIDLIFLANYEDKKTKVGSEIVVCKRGDVNLSIKALADRWKWSRHKVSDFLNLLEKDNMVVQTRTYARTVITIVNYDVYQCSSDYKDTQRTTVRTSKGQHKDITNKVNKDNKEINKDMYGDFHHVLLTREEYEKLAVDYGKAERDAAIKYFDEYLENNPKYKKPNHNLCIRNWVFTAVAERKEKDAKYRVNQSTTYRGFDCNA